MELYNAFLCLGLSMTQDVCAIKKAYQAQITHHHPEDDPQGFMQVHQAYKTAMAYAQGKNSTPSQLDQPVWQPEKIRDSREETGYDRLFANLDAHQTEDLTQPKKVFSRKLWGLKLHWLPIPLRSWQRFFASEAFQLCRRDEACMEKLFELILGKIHTYGVFRFLLSRLWELNVWQKSEDAEALANKTQNCITQLHKQYSHYLKLDTESVKGRLIHPVCWYYQAIPFYFKLLVTMFLFPLISFGSQETLIPLLFGFYAVEVFIWILKCNREQGLYHPVVRKKNGVPQVKIKGHNGVLILGTIYASMIHFACCLALMDAFQ